MNDFVFVTQLHDEQIYVLSQSLNVIEYVYELIEVEIVYDVSGHIQNDKLDEEWFHHFPHMCIQLDTDEIIRKHDGSWDQVISALLDDS